jgi:D-alanyl-D-alanine carboxypeptidase (penicillin-binding protein 5/6)
VTARRPAAALAAALALAAVVALAALLGPLAARGAAVAATAPPALRAPSAILVEPATGDVVVGRRSADSRPIASATKLMTALLALERLPLGRRISVVPYAASAVESTVGLRAGERLTTADLLRAALLASANEAAQTLAVRAGGSEARFVRLMNARARALGLTDTRYTTPIGLDRPGNRSSARDLVKLTLILRRHPFFRKVTNRPRATLRSGARTRTVLNRNTLVRTWAPANGVKTGHTLGAGYVLVGSAARRGVLVVSAVLGAPSESARDADTLALLRFGLARYRRVVALRAGRRLRTVPVEGHDEAAALVAARTVRRTIRRGERVRLRVRGVPERLEGPLPAGARAGTVDLRWRGRVVERVPLVTARAVPAPSLASRAGDAAGRALLVALLAAGALGSLQLVLLRRRRRRRRRRGAEPSGVA